MKIMQSQGIGMKELIATLVVSGLLMIVGVVVFAQVKAAMPTGVSAVANTTLATVESTTYSAFGLATVALIVMAAAAIIGILIRAFGA